MRVLMIVLASFVALVVDVRPSDAVPRGPRPWCIEKGLSGMRDCGYYNHQQCLMSASGVGGTCVPNPSMGPDQARVWQRYNQQQRRR